MGSEMCIRDREDNARRLAERLEKELVVDFLFLVRGEPNFIQRAIEVFLVKYLGLFG